MLSSEMLLQNRYRIIRRIGQGGMGAVYEARHEELGHLVALKETFHTDDEGLRRAFKREARMLAGLQHPGLPRVTDYFTENDGLFLVMEYVAGDDLYELLSKRKEPFSVPQILRWADQLLDVLDYLHSQNPPVIHRDIKPNNIKLNQRGDVVLLDFGLAKGAVSEATSLLASRSVLGFTLTYAPLEQILKADQNVVEHLSVFDAEKIQRALQAPTDARSDLYALAATLYHLLTKKQPAQSPTRALAIWSGRADPLLPANEINREIPFPAAELLRRAMALSSEDRISSAAEMRRMLSESTQRAPAKTDDFVEQPTIVNLPPTVPVSDKLPKPSEETKNVQPLETQPAVEQTDGKKITIPVAGEQTTPHFNQPYSDDRNKLSPNPLAYILPIAALMLLGVIYYSFNNSASRIPDKVDIKIDTPKNTAVASNTMALNTSNLNSLTNSFTTASPAVQNTNVNSSNSTGKRKIVDLMDLSADVKYERLVSVWSEPYYDNHKDYPYRREGDELYVTFKDAVLATQKTTLDGEGGAYYTATLTQEDDDVLLTIKMKENTRYWVWRNNGVIVQVDFNKGARRY